MKVGITTFHFVPNQGAVLQCYAMQKYLEQQGHEAFVIDYRPGYHTVRYAGWKNPFSYALWYWKKYRSMGLFSRTVFSGRAFLRCLISDFKGTDRNMECLFREFTNKHLHLTRPYTSLKKLRKNPPDLDAYISGSDQLWNPALLDQEYDPAYFLDFGNPDVIRIAYAVSLGNLPSKGECEKMRMLCKNLDAISLREYNEEAISAIERDVHVCIDPTLLLDAEDYEAVECENDQTEPYIFVYGFETNADIQAAVDLAVKRYGCRVINGSPARVRLHGNVQNLRDFAPDRFLTLIKNAACVVTNSFHGTALSIVYKKNFITVPHTTRGVRMIELLGKLGLNSCLWKNEAFSFETDVDYTSVDEKLHSLRKCAIEYLTLALNGARGEDIPHHAEETSFVCVPPTVEEQYPEWNAYAGYYRDSAILKQSASGGVASVLSEEMIARGGCVFGVAYAEDLKSASFVCAETMEALQALKGSKYIAADKKLPNGVSIYDAVEEKLKLGKQVLFIGLGCEVGALLKQMELRKINTSMLYTVDLICHGPTLPKIQKDFVESLEQRYRSKVVSFTARSKEKGWELPYVHAVFANGKHYKKPFYETDMGYAFKTYSRGSCFACHFKGNDHVADMTVGDYWGLKPTMKGYNPDGVSVMLTRTEKGERLLSEIDQTRFALDRADIALAIRNNPMFEESRAKPIYYDTFVHDYEEHGLHYAVTHSEGYKIYKKAALKRRIQQFTRKHGKKI